jgi:putative selenium metabolism protein SsnA
VKKKSLITHANVITFNQSSPYLPDHAILIEGDRIARLVPMSDPLAQNSRGIASVINAAGRVVMPGLINAHTHFYSSFARGYARVKPSRNFVEVLQNMWWRLDRSLSLEDCYFSTLMACIQGIKSGTTTFIDHHASPGAITGSLDRIYEAVFDAGLRAGLCYEVSDRDGSAAARLGIEENGAMLAKLKAQESDRFFALFGLHASFTLSDETLRAAQQVAAQSGAGFHVHVAEDSADESDSIQKYGKRVVERLDEHGLLGPRTICAHCVHTDDHEREILAQRGSIVVHNPQSNMNNAVGAMDLKAFLDRGILVGLGTDAMTANMREELRSGLWLRRHVERDPSCGFAELATLLTENNPQIADRYWPGEGVGRIIEGGKADIIILDDWLPTPLDSSNLWGHLVFGLSQAQVATTMVGGRLLMAERRLIHLDERQVAEKCRELCDSMWRRLDNL